MRTVFLMDSFASRLKHSVSLCDFWVSLYPSPAIPGWLVHCGDHGVGQSELGERGWEWAALRGGLFCLSGCVGGTVLR